MDAGDDTQKVVCDVGGVTSPDLATIEALCFLRLSLTDRGCAVGLRGASGELWDLVRLCGLSGVLPLVDQGQTEEGEQPGGVEEEVEPGDPAV